MRSDGRMLTNETCCVCIQSGLYVIENVLWNAVPNFMRKLDADVEELLGVTLPSDLCVVKFGSWMGGDRGMFITIW